jgi:hypothetical protein
VSLGFVRLRHAYHDRKQLKLTVSIVEKLLDGLKKSVLPRLVDPEGKGIHRVMISTPLAESAVAAYLTDLAARVEPKGVKVGSYPRWEKSRNTVTLVGRSGNLRLLHASC